MTADYYDTNLQHDSDCNECRHNEKKIKSLREENERLRNAGEILAKAMYSRDARIAEFESALRLDQAWPLRDVIQKLVDGVDILLHEKDYDALGWEDYEHSFTRGKEIIAQLKALSPDPVNRETKE
jgi:hypothetical protein